MKQTIGRIDFQRWGLLRMRRLGNILLAVLAFTWGLAAVSHAAVRQYDKLSFDERFALQTSERRVALYDQELARLDRQRQYRKVSSDDYQWRSTTLVFYIQQESLFQNAILVRGSDLPLRARDVLESIEHGVLMVPVGVGYVVSACPQVLQFLACVH